ncbi:MAG: J domain-containing protein [Phycisphaerae bacterium]
MQSTMDPYKVLDLQAGADAGQVKAAYRKQALRWHPDRRGGDPAAAAQFRRIHRAYRMLARSDRPGSVPPRQTAVDFARRDLTWLYAGSYSAAMTHKPRIRRTRSFLSRVRLQARFLAARLAPALRVSGWLLVVVWLLLGTLGAARIVEGCYRRLNPPGPNEPFRAELGDQGQWIFAWALAGALVLLLARRGQHSRRAGGVLLLSAAATCLGLHAAGSALLLMLLPVLAGAQLTAGCLLAFARGGRGA